MRGDSVSFWRPNLEQKRAQKEKGRKPDKLKKMI